jgi:hypothetical protein
VIGAKVDRPHINDALHGGQLPAAEGGCTSSCSEDDDFAGPDASYLSPGIEAVAARRPPFKETTLMTDDCRPVAVSRRICAPAHDIFQILASPARHPEFDGSQSLRGAARRR